jgi:hypothetical protein
MDPLTRPPRTNTFQREGEYWTLAHPGGIVRLRHGKGVRYLAELLARPGVEVHSLQLAGATGHSSGFGPLLDERAKTAYRNRISDLREVVVEAELFHDTEKASLARAELDALARELAGAIGLGGRNRPAGSAAERARINVTRALRTTIGRIEQTFPALGHHLDTSVRTGAFVSYQPGPSPLFTWRCAWT